MEKRQQLDLNAPLLSARRYSSPSRSSELVKRKVLEKTIPPSRQQSLPSKKSDCQYDDVCKPASVPFHWEQIPGRPKNGVESHSHTPEEPSITPRLPPGRVSGPSRFASGERSNDQNIYKSQVEAFSFVDHATLLEKLNESLQCKDESDSESEDEAYSDALDTLSVTGSWSWNYSVSGISGYHGSSGVKPSGNFCIDTNTRDFMMNRFLPAAKAAVLEAPPQYVVKKQQQQQVPMEQPKLLFRKSISGEVKPSIKKYYSEYVDNVESEDEIQDFSSKVPVKKSGKAWGIIPRFCVKNSLCLLNPLPGMKSKSRAPTPPPTREVRRLTRNAHSGPLDKNACHVPQQKRFHSGLLSRDLPIIENNPSNDPNKTGVSPLRRYNRSGSISPYRNESPKSPFREGAGFLGVPKEVEDFNANKIASSRKLFKALQDVSKMNQTNERGSSVPTGDVVEKMVYIESVNRKDSAVVVHDQVTSALDEGKKQSPKSELNQSVDVKMGVEGEEKLELDPLLKPSSPLLAPPLPKSPSESWLWRTLPSISLGNPFAHSRRSFHLHSKKQGQKGDAKWETIVKTTNTRHDHVRYSQELIPHVTHRQSKS